MSTAPEIADWIAVRLAHELQLEPSAVARDTPVARLGVDSLTAATLTADLEDYLGRALPETLLSGDITVDGLGRWLASGSSAPADALPRAAAPRSARAVAPAITWTFAERRLRAAARLVAVVLTRLDAEGLERLPANGPVIIAVNHLHILDALWVFALLPRRTLFVVAAEFRRRPVVGWLLRIGGAIFVERGAGDRGAVEMAVEALRAGAAVGVAPEGRLSRTGGLIRGLPGVARMAAEAGASVVPLALSGQEHAWRCWRRGRRVPIRVRVGSRVPPPIGAVTARSLEAYSDEVMRGLAAALPPAYRGVYAAE